MATITYLLKNPASKKNTLIFLVFWIDQYKIRLSTGEHIKPKFWNPDAHRARETQWYKDWESQNFRLNEIELKVMQKYREHISNNEIIKLNLLRNEIKDILRPPVDSEKDKMTFFKAIDQYIGSVNRKPWTIKHYRTTFNILKGYKKVTGKETDFDDITIDFYEAFTVYLEKCNFALNTIGSHVKNIKVFMNYAFDKGYTNNSSYRLKKFKTLEETADTIYLSETELTSIYDLDLSNNKRLEQQRDLFIIGSYTGFRFSDLIQLKPENIIKDGTRIRLKTSKTSEIVEIPLHFRIKTILEKYGWNLPQSISDQKMNEYLKEIGKLALLNQIVVKSITRGGIKTTSNHKKCELITVHTARRSFATNAYLAGVPAISLMKIIGHRTEKAFMKYIKVTQEQNADLLSNHPFFSQ